IIPEILLTIETKCNYISPLVLIQQAGGYEFRKPEIATAYYECMLRMWKKTSPVLQYELKEKMIQEIDKIHGKKLDSTLVESLRDIKEQLQQQKVSPSKLKF